MNKQSDNQEKLPSNPFNKLIRRIWYVFLAIGSIGLLLQNKFEIKETFWIISVSTLFLAFFCAVILFNKSFQFAERILYTIATIVLMFVYPHWLDIPAYLTNNYRVVEGVPTEFEYRSPYKAGRYLHVEISNVELKLPSSIPNMESDNWFVIHYLPYSKFIIDYKIISKQEGK
ncbi:hypothetical protein [Neobacillus kokaensis]|uniref:DUF4131 domain-containing protein n=1 Tax=Neobacillus kokaensis TaxID=2759023 RepID=A0ABQ3MVC2_9BACI|nr:hypothetical protein [Neobacillus kokaensis]GHH96605.1 hypothetical protein AM1BK_01480 [Neobacillus kokaensis]